MRRPTSGTGSFVVDPADRGRRAFRSADDFAVEAHRAAESLSAGCRAIADAIHSSAVRGASAIALAAAGTDSPRERLLDARRALVEARYLLHLARRTGALDLRRFRPAVARHDTALRDLQAWIRDVAPG